MTAPLTLKRLGIDTYNEAVVYLHERCHVCLAEGFEAQTRVQVQLGNKSILATVNTLTDQHLLEPNQVGLSEFAWTSLEAKSGDTVVLSHPMPLNSLQHVRSKVFGHSLTKEQLFEIITDITEGRYSDIHIATFITACAGNRLSRKEIIHLSEAMVKTGNHLHWDSPMVVDKHCVGGLPGNRTSMIIVPIVAAFGLIMPKTSSRAITSPAGTADTMEVLAPVDLDLKTMQHVVKKEGGCIAWGHHMRLSPADDMLIRVERAIDIDSESQMVASILSKKIAAGSTHILIDIPVGESAKVRHPTKAQHLKHLLIEVARAFGIHIEVIYSEGLQPVGRGIGPSLEAKDVLAVLQNKPDAPKDLRHRALRLAGHILEFSSQVEIGEGEWQAEQLLLNGKAWQKFQAICEAQGGMREPKEARYQHVITAFGSGEVIKFDNRRLARLAKLAGAPQDKTAGILLQTTLGSRVQKGEPLFTLQADSKGQLDYALAFLAQQPDIITLR